MTTVVFDLGRIEDEVLLGMYLAALNMPDGAPSAVLFNALHEALDREVDRRKGRTTENVTLTLPFHAVSQDAILDFQMQLTPGVKNLADRGMGFGAAFSYALCAYANGALKELEQPVVDLTH